MPYPARVVPQDGVLRLCVREWYCWTDARQLSQNIGPLHDVAVTGTVIATNFRGRLTNAGIALWSAIAKVHIRAYDESLYPTGSAMPTPTIPVTTEKAASALHKGRRDLL